MRWSPLRHNLARLRVYLQLGQKQLADISGCSPSTIQSVEIGRLRLSEELARRISLATGVNLRWLMDNNLHAPISITRDSFERLQAQHKVGNNEFAALLVNDYAISFYGQMLAIFASAVKRDSAELALWKVATFLEQCRAEFGHDRQTIPDTEQFGLRPDDSPYLKHRQVEIGIALAKKYLKKQAEL